MDRCRIHCEEPYSLLFVCLSILHKLLIVCQQCHVTSERLDLIHNSRLAEALNMNKNPRICKQKVVAREVFFSNTFLHTFPIHSGYDEWFRISTGAFPHA